MEHQSPAAPGGLPGVCQRHAPGTAGRHHSAAAAGSGRWAPRDVAALRKDQKLGAHHDILEILPAPCFVPGVLSCWFFSSAVSFFQCPEGG